MNNKKRFLRWLPAVVVMAAIFGLSSIPSNEMPSFGLVVKKGSHMLGYGLLALTYWYGLYFNKHHWRLAFLLALLYAITDELHQSFVPGRHPSWVDALIIDGSGAALMLLAVSEIRKRMR